MKILALLFLLQDPSSAEHHKLAENYSAARDGVSMLVMIDGKIVYEKNADEACGLASGTKSFSGAMAVAAMADGKLDLDEKVSDTLTEWRGTDKESMTLRQLLTLTGGLDPGKIGEVPEYADAIQVKLRDKPGTKFRYGPVPFQVFGEVMRRKLDGNPLKYMEERIFNPIGMKVANWRKGKDGNPRLPSGARLSAREWAKFGELVRLDGKWGDKPILDPKLLHQCFRGTKTNKDYGITWWLSQGEIVMAAGKGKQRLYVSREHRMVVVRQAPVDSKAGYQDEEFLARLLRGETAAGRPARMENVGEAKDAATRQAERIIARNDKDNDKHLSRDELPGALARLFDRINTDEDEKLSLRELAEAIRKRDK